MPTFTYCAVVGPMYVSSNELASRFAGITGDLRKMREAIANCLFEDASLYAKHASISTRALTADLVSVPDR
jgi:hypothetical protein